MSFWRKVLSAYFLPPFQADYHLYSNLFVHELSKKISSLQALFKSASSAISDSDRTWANQLAADAIETLSSVLPSVIRLSSHILLPVKLYRTALRLRNSFAPLSTSGEGLGVRILDQLASLYTEVKKSVETTGRIPLSDVAKKSLEKIRAEKFATISQHQIELSSSGLALAERFFLSPTEAQQYEHLLTNLLRNAIESIEQKIVGAIRESPTSLPVSGRPARAELGPRPGDARVRSVVSLIFENLPGLGLTLSVEDTGCGMDEPAARRFTQSGFTSKSGGKGLGITESAFRSCKGLVRYEVSSAPAAGTKITLFLSPPFLRQYLRRPLVVRWGVGLAVVLLIISFFLSPFSKSKPVDFETFLRQCNPVVFDVDGKQVINNGWNKIPCDLEHDGREEVLVVNNFSTDDGKLATITCFDRQNGDTLWMRTVGKDSIYDVEQSDSIFTPSGKEYDIRQILVDSFSHPTNPLVAIISFERTYFTAEVIFWRKKDGMEKVYYHPGNIEFQFYLPAIRKGEFLFHGVNNLMSWRHCAGIVIPESLSEKTQAPPYKSLDKNLQRAEEMLYVVFPRIKDSLPVLWEKGIAQAESIVEELGGYLVRLNDGRQYKLGSHFRFVRYYFDPDKYKNFLRNNDLKSKDYPITFSDSFPRWHNVESYNWGRRLK